LATASLKNAYGDETYNSIRTMIDAGATFQAVRQRLAEQDKNPEDFTIEDFTAMHNASAAGQQDWERKLSAFSLLIQSNDPANVHEAAAQFSELFPGVTYSPDQLMADLGSERFAKGMSDIATLATTFDTWNEAKASFDRLNLGIDQDVAADMFQAMKINAIDEEWTAITDSDWFRGLDAGTADLVKQTFNAGLTGELEFDIQPVYNIVDANGNFVKPFTNVADANVFLGENADKGYQIQKKSNYIYKSLTTGDTVVVNNGTGAVENGSGETVQTTAAKFAKSGSSYGEEDIQAYYDAKGKLPTSVAEMDAWDKQQYDMSFWNRMDTDYPGGDLTAGGARPTITTADVDTLISARESGDKRADSYFMVPEDLARLEGAAGNMESGYERASAAERARKYSIVLGDVRSALANNAGKIVTVGGKSYVITGTLTGNIAEVYDVSAKKSINVDVESIVNNGLKNAFTGS